MFCLTFYFLQNELDMMLNNKSLSFFVPSSARQFFLKSLFCAVFVPTFILDPVIDTSAQFGLF